MMPVLKLRREQRSKVPETCRCHNRRHRRRRNAITEIHRIKPLECLTREQVELLRSNETHCRSLNQWRQPRQLASSMTIVTTLERALRAFNLDTSKICLTLSKDSERRTERRKVRFRHFHIQLHRYDCRRAGSYRDKRGRRNTHGHASACQNGVDEARPVVV